MPELRRRIALLVEGQSDAAVVRVLLRSHCLDLDDGAVRIIAMGGVTNIRTHLEVERRDSECVVLGLYDAPEERFVVGALRASGHVVQRREDVARLGFFACDRDLEDELIRALGAAAVEDTLQELGELDRFRTFQRQREWRGRELSDQLHRFAGSGSGRKVALAERLATRMTPTTTPRPLAQLVGRVASLAEPPPDGLGCR